MDVNATLLSIALGTDRVNHTIGEDELDIFETLTQAQRDALEVYRVLAYAIGGLILVSNVIVVISSLLIMKRSKECKSTYMLLGNVSLADAFIGANVIFGISVRHNANSEGQCIVQIGMIVSPTMVSIFSVGLIAVDRYIYILHGLHYGRWINNARVRLGIILSWILGLSLGFMPATGWIGDSLDGRKCWYIAIAPPGLIALISVFGVLPIFIVVILYSIILFHALRKVSQLQSAGDQSKKHQNHPDDELRINRGKSRVGNVQGRGVADLGASSHSLSVNGQGKSRGNAVLGASSHSLSGNGQGKSRGDAVLGASSHSLSIHTIASSTESGLSSISGGPPDSSNFKKIVIKMRQSTKSDRKRKDNSEPNKWRAIKVVLLTTGSFVCTWVPYFIATVVYLFCDKETEEDKCHRVEVALASPLAVLGLFNSLLNPLIYAWWHRGFQNAVKKIFCGFRRACVSQNSIQSQITGC